MAPKEEIEFLKERAIKFLENGKYLQKKGVYDLAAFNLEQFCQLYLKYKLFLKIGDYPRTHSLKRLFNELKKVSPDKKRWNDFIERHIETISNLENAYMTSRYLPMEFEKIEVEKMFKFSEGFKKFMEKI